jgi:hypothetical protein
MAAPPTVYSNQYYIEIHLQAEERAILGGQIALWHRRWRQDAAELHAEQFRQRAHADASTAVKAQPAQLAFRPRVWWQMEPGNSIFKRRSEVIRRTCRVYAR